MFASVRFTLPTPHSMQDLARRLRRAAWPIRQPQAMPPRQDNAPTLDEFFVASAFLDFGGVPTELVRWQELQSGGASGLCSRPRPAKPEPL